MEGKNTNTIMKNRETKMAEQELSHLHEIESGHVHSHVDANGNVHMHSHPNSKAVSNRLAKAIGHLQAVKGMVDRGEDCAQILVQLAAVRSAINNAGKIVLMDHLNHCIVDAVEEGDMKKIEEFGSAIQQFVK